MAWVACGQAVGPADGARSDVRSDDETDASDGLVDADAGVLAALCANEGQRAQRCDGRSCAMSDAVRECTVGFGRFRTEVLSLLYACATTLPDDCTGSRYADLLRCVGQSILALPPSDTERQAVATFCGSCPSLASTAGVDAGDTDACIAALSVSADAGAAFAPVSELIMLNDAALQAIVSACTFQMSTDPTCANRITTCVGLEFGVDAGASTCP